MFVEGLEAQGLTSGCRNRAHDIFTAKQSVVVVRDGSQGTFQSGILSISKVVVVGDSVSVVGAVEGLGETGEDIRLHQHLSTVTSVDSVTAVQVL